MSESIHNCAVAYGKGVRSAEKHHNKGNLTNCPYGATKLELKHWWIVGFHDKKNNTIDTNMLIKVRN